MLEPLELLLAIVGAAAIVGTLTVIGLKIRTLLLLGQKLRSLADLVQVDGADIDALRDRLDVLETKREFSYAPEIDGLARKVNSLSNYGRTLELTGMRVERIEKRVTRLETEIPPKGATEVPDPEAGA